ncbi:hypothetical protein D1BOALGB6SA_7393 [Olavius sp. associated proteobacterium Delta 1]|nr:hypothetical protein D1BOALGB6SA_7393 [Olavius sp. associated proteobacterium Delta 1]
MRLLLFSDLHSDARMASKLVAVSKEVWISLPMAEALAAGP